MGEEIVCQSLSKLKINKQGISKTNLVILNKLVDAIHQDVTNLSRHVYQSTLVFAKSLNRAYAEQSITKPASGEY